MRISFLGLENMGIYLCLNVLYELSIGFYHVTVDFRKFFFLLVDLRCMEFIGLVIVFFFHSIFNTLYILIL